MQDKDSKQIICQLLREFYQKGWCSGSGGGISIRESDDCVYVAPSGVLKEYVQENEIYRVDIEGNVVQNPQSKNKLKPSECTPLFNEIYKLRRAGAAIHSHSLNCTLVTRLFGTEVQVIDFEMIKGIAGHKNSEFCVIPIIENTERECELTQRLGTALVTYPRAQGVLVRNHGMYVFGKDWQQAKIHAECYDYLFNALIEMKKLNFAPKTTLASDSHIRAWYIDEEIIEKNKKDGLDLDLRQPYQKQKYDWVEYSYLQSLGVQIHKFNGSEEDEKLNKFKNEQGLVNSDKTIFSEKNTTNYQEILKKFNQEHTHDVQKIRYLLDGSGFYDIRSHEDKWVRIHLAKGDLIIIPQGMYHRFSTDANNYSYIMRIAQKETNIETIPRQNGEQNETRKQYIQKFVLPLFNNNQEEA